MGHGEWRAASDSPRRAANLEAQVFDLGWPADVADPGRPIQKAGVALLPDPCVHHTPLRALDRVDAATQGLITLAAFAQRAAVVLERQSGRSGGCTDVGFLDVPGEARDALACAPLATAELRRIQHAVAQLANEHERLGRWLGDEIDAAVRGGVQRPCASVVPLGERPRLIARDWVAADLNFTVSRVLGRISRSLDSLDFADAHGSPDGDRMEECEAVLRLAVRRLGFVRELASGHMDFLHDMDTRWQSMRQRIDAAMG